MAAPKFTPAPAESGDKSYVSPDFVPDSWVADRPGDLTGRQPEGSHYGYQGPDQGYALLLAERIRPQLVLSDLERADDAIEGCLGIALRRASIYGRAPVMHDLRIAFTIWGFLDQAPDAELVARRVTHFEGVASVHHYDERRTLADSVPEETLRKSYDQVKAAYPAKWRELLGV